MRLIKPNPGELADRQTILVLKIGHLPVTTISDPTVSTTNAKGVIARQLVTKEHGGHGVNFGPFFDELELIELHLKQNWFTPDIAEQPGFVDKYDVLYDQLEEVNSNLWDLEDQARVLRDAPPSFDEDISHLKRCKEVLVSINNNNDNRARIVKEINKLWGFNITEKLH